MWIMGITSLLTGSPDPRSRTEGLRVFGLYGLLNYFALFVSQGPYRRIFRKGLQRLTETNQKQRQEDNGNHMETYCYFTTIIALWPKLSLGLSELAFWFSPESHACSVLCGSEPQAQSLPPSLRLTLGT